MNTKVLQIAALIALAIVPIPVSSYFIVDTHARQQADYVLRLNTPQYVIIHPFFPGTDTDMSWVPDAINALGRGSITRRLAIAGVIQTLDWSDASINNWLEMFFSAAEQNDVPLLLHLDSEHFYDHRPDLWNWWNNAAAGYNASNVDNVEWANWTGPTKKGFLNWGSTIEFAPRLCFESVAVRNEISRKDQIIVSKLDQWLTNLTASNKTSLFLGIDPGWETGIDDYRNVSWVPEPYRYLLGYNALTKRGFSAANPPPDLYSAIVGVVHDFAAFEAQTLADKGIPKDKIFTHIWGAETTKPGYKQHAPMDVAFNNYSVPGFSLYPGYSHQKLSSLVAGKEWTVMETPPLQDYSPYLNLGFCKAIVIYNWGGSIKTDPAAIAAIRNLLNTEVDNPAPVLVPWLVVIILYGSIIGMIDVLLLTKSKRNKK